MVYIKKGTNPGQGEDKTSGQLTPEEKAAEKAAREQEENRKKDPSGQAEGDGFSDRTAKQGVLTGSLGL